MSYADFVQHILAKAYMRQVLGQEKFDQWSRRYNLAYNRLWNRRIFWKVGKPHRLPISRRTAPCRAKK